MRPPLTQSSGGHLAVRYGWLALILLTATAASQVGRPSARAQEPAAKALPAKAEPAPAKVEPAPAKAEPAPAAAEAAKAPPASAPAPAEGTGPPEEKTRLRWVIESSGFIGLVLFCLSVYFTALVIRLFMEFRVGEAVPPTLVERLESAIRDKKFQEAYDACKDSDSFLARLVRTGIANLPNGRPEAKESMQAMSDEVVTAMEMKISYLAIIGTLGPMIGLVGTILGMIMSFDTIARARGTQPRPDEVAQGISTALLITLEGVTLAVPAIFFFAFFRNRIAQITLEANKVADRTINSLVSSAKTTTTTTTATARPA